MVVAAVELGGRWPGRLLEPPDLKVEHCRLAAWSDGNQSSDDSKMR